MCLARGPCALRAPFSGTDDITVIGHDEYRSLAGAAVAQQMSECKKSVEFVALEFEHA